MAWLRKRGRVFYVEFPVEGRRYPKRISTETTNRREAQAFLEEWLRVHPDGEDVARVATAGTTTDLIERWIADREARGKRSAAHEAARLREYVIPRLGTIPADDLRPSQIRAFVRELERLPSPRGGVLAPRTVLHVYRTLRQVFADAVADELLDRNPVVLKRADMPKKLDKDPHWRAGAVFSAAEVAALVFDPRVPEDRRVLYALEFLGGLRTGETAARRWRDWNAAEEPLGSLVVTTSYDTRARTEGPTKTKRPRRVPVHPTTADLLRRWKAGGWARTFGRPPAPDDLICPSPTGAFRNASLSHRYFTEDLRTLGLRHRRHYDTRRTFISLGLAGGGRKDVLRWITHSPGDVFDEYTTLPWAALCEAVAAIRIGPPAAEPGLRLVASVEQVQSTGTPGARDDDEPPKDPGGARGSVSSGSTAEQGNRTPQQRLSAPSTGFEDRARHQPRTLCRARVYVAWPARSSAAARARLPRGLRELGRPVAGDRGAVRVAVR